MSPFRLTRAAWHERERTGRCSEAERDRIEEQVGAFVRTCTDNISRLEANLAGEPALGAHVLAHRHGAVRGALCRAQDWGRLTA